MYNHEPVEYNCPFCRVANKIEDDYVITKQDDVFYRDAHITAFVSSHWWPNNEWNIIIIPNRHIENIYDLPNYLSNKIHAFEKRVAIALKEVYGCNWISSRQHNEPQGNQDVWHYHLHVFPRFQDDRLYELHLKKYQSDAWKRKAFAWKLRDYFNE